jgi:hypothetical protein
MYLTEEETAYRQNSIDYQFTDVMNELNVTRHEIQSGDLADLLTLIRRNIESIRDRYGKDENGFTDIHKRRIKL